MSFQTDKVYWAVQDLRPFRPGERLPLGPVVDWVAGDSVLSDCSMDIAELDSAGTAGPIVD